MGITLGKKQLNKGRVSLYLNYSYNGKRRKEYLGIILDAPTSAERRAENRNKVLIARQRIGRASCRERVCLYV